ncbi:MAG: nucleotidyl transferase AbiEii/AbiGii toxin family protein [Proteobacteria bacterium]|nr:nucleotidyl transferase AbiEii/AbiGii toxin family protein [Pseudomonadota bacterium]
MPFARPTRDIDLLGHVDNSVENLEDIVRSICVVDVDDDGMVFDADSVRGERIKEDTDYEGVRVKFAGFLERVRVPMQIDIGFGDVVYPPARELEYPTLLEFAAPSLRVYPRETVIAEKFQAMVYLGSLNSRMKDFFDIWLLAKTLNFDGRTLGTAITNTFKNRQTELDINPVALSKAFAQADTTRRQWTAFIRKGLVGEAPKQIQESIEVIREFLLPVAHSIIEGNIFDFYWTAPGPWSPIK